LDLGVLNEFAYTRHLSQPRPNFRGVRKTMAFSALCFMAVVDESRKPSGAAPRFGTA